MNKTKTTQTNTRRTLDARSEAERAAWTLRAQDITPQSQWDRVVPQAGGMWAVSPIR